MKLCDKLAKLRRQRSMTQMELAELLNVSRQAISRWETGETAPSTENLQCLSRLYAVPLEALLNDDLALPEPLPVEVTAEVPAVVEEKRRPRSRTALWMAVAVLATLVVVLGGLWLRHWHEEVKISDIDALHETDVSDMQGDTFTIMW